jgi:hypothetical protein
VNDVNALPEMVQVRTNWTAVESAHALHANQLLAQVGPALSDGRPDGIFLTFGSAQNPALMADRDPEGVRRHIERLAAEGVPVNVLGQFHVSRPLLDQLIAVLQETAAKYDQAEAAAARVAGGEKVT